MKRLLALIAAALLTVSPVRAQFLTLGVSNTTTSGGSSYTGPGDVVSGAKSWYGLRAYNGTKAAAGVAAVRLCTGSDALCTDIHVTSTGDLSAADITTSTCTTTCTVKTWYDQTGNGLDMTQTTIAYRAVFHTSCISALPCAYSDQAQTSYTAVTYGLSQPYTLNVAEYHTSDSAFEYVLGNDTSSTTHVFIYDPTLQSAIVSNGTQLTNSGTYPYLTWVGYSAVFNSTSSIGAINTTQTTGDAGTGGLTNLQFSGAGAGGGGRSFGGRVFEFGGWPVAFTGTQINNLYSNQHTYGIN